MGIFHLKEFDTQPILMVALVNPNGTPHDLTVGSPSVKLHINLANDVGKMTRQMTIDDASGGIVVYLWDRITDWDTPGNLFASTAHLMDYEVTRAISRVTFPNDGYDTLSILRHITDD